MTHAKIDSDDIYAWDGPLLPLEDIDYLDRIEHGTSRGYGQHRRWRVAMCDECRAAHTAARSAEKRAARERKRMEKAQ